jgi:ribosome-binding protein aMBF1 (putative translation factor)
VERHDAFSEKETYMGGMNYLTLAQRRQRMAEALVERSVAMQIHALRRLRGWDQKTLAHLIHSAQSAVSRMEDPNYGKHSVRTLLKLAHAFECELVIQFVHVQALQSQSEA